MNHYLKLVKIGALLLVVAAGLLACQRNRDNVEASSGSSTSAAAAMKIDANPTGFTASEKAFLADAMKADNDEVEMGQLALQKSQNSDVKGYARMLIDDHTSDSKTVADLMNKGERPEDIRTAPSAEVVANQNLLRLRDTSEPAFDSEFADIEVKDHQTDLQKYQNQATSTIRSDIRDYAADDVPVLQKHLQKAQDLKTKLAGQ